MTKINNIDPLGKSKCYSSLLQNQAKLQSSSVISPVQKQSS